MSASIGPHNIKEYITYLYYAKYKTPVPNTILDSWSNMSYQEIQNHLRQLYQQWQLQSYEIQGYEKAFYQITNYPTAIGATNKPNDLRNAKSIANTNKTAAVQQQFNAIHSQLNKKKQSSNAAWKYIAAAIIIGLGGIGIVQYFNQGPVKVNNNIENTVTIKEQKQDNNNTSTVRALSDKEKMHAQRIEQFIKSENERNLSGIMTLLSPNIEQFKSIAYPRTEEIESYYHELWQAYKVSTNARPEVKRISENVYSIKTRNTLQVSDSSKSTNQNSEQKITFNNQNEIIKIERLK